MLIAPYRFSGSSARAVGSKNAASRLASRPWVSWLSHANGRHRKAPEHQKLCPTPLVRDPRPFRYAAVLTHAQDPAYQDATSEAPYNNTPANTLPPRPSPVVVLAPPRLWPPIISSPWSGTPRRPKLYEPIRRGNRSSGCISVCFRPTDAQRELDWSCAAHRRCPEPSSVPALSFLCGGVVRPRVARIVRPASAPPPYHCGAQTPTTSFSVLVARRGGARRLSETRSRWRLRTL